MAKAAAAKEASGVRQVLRQTKTVAIGAVHPHPKNPRQGDVGAIVESIKANGVYRPVFAQVRHDNKKPSGDILAGSHSWTAQKQLGAKTIEVTFLDVTDDQAIRIMLADNATSNAATMNEAALASVLLEMQQTVASLVGTGYDGDALDDLPGRLNADAHLGRPLRPRPTCTLGEDDDAWRTCQREVPRDHVSG